MADNSRGHHNNGNRRKRDGPELNLQEANKRNRSSQGLRDPDLDRVINENRNPGTSGLSHKRNFSGTEYDGQLSDE